MNVHVTAKDIAKGRPLPSSCPVALALARAGVGHPFVTPNRIGGNVGLRDFWQVTPDAVRAFVVAFDDGQPVKPFDFDLDVR